MKILKVRQVVCADEAQGSTLADVFSMQVAHFCATGQKDNACGVAELRASATESTLSAPSTCAAYCNVVNTAAKKTLTSFLNILFLYNSHSPGSLQDGSS